MFLVKFPPSDFALSDSPAGVSTPVGLSEYGKSRTVGLSEYGKSRTVGLSVHDCWLMR